MYIDAEDVELDIISPFMDREVMLSLKQRIAEEVSDIAKSKLQELENENGEAITNS